MWSPFVRGLPALGMMCANDLGGRMVADRVDLGPRWARGRRRPMAHDKENACVSSSVALRRLNVPAVVRGVTVFSLRWPRDTLVARLIAIQWEASMPNWFRRLADIPGVGYPGSEGVVRTKLKWHNAVPEVHISDFDGRRHESLMWPSGASPAHELGFRSDDDLTSAALKRVAEALELPGEPSDYHFAIQSCLEYLLAHRREEPWQLQEVERLAWLDIRLVEACPESVRSGEDPKDGFFNVLAFSRLVDLYTCEGFIREALDVAERGVRFQQRGFDVEDLRGRLARIESEHAG